VEAFDRIALVDLRMSTFFFFYGNRPRFVRMASLFFRGMIPGWGFGIASLAAFYNDVCPGLSVALPPDSSTSRSRVKQPRCAGGIGTSRPIALLPSPCVFPTFDASSPLPYSTLGPQFPGLFFFAPCEVSPGAGLRRAVHPHTSFRGAQNELPLAPILVRRSDRR